MAGQHPARLPAQPVDRSTYHYRSKRTGQAVLMKRVREIAETQVRYGYRRIHGLLRREGWLVNAKQACLLYREIGLQFRNKTPERRVRAQLRADRSAASGATQVWAMDFVHYQLFDGRKIWVLTIVDTPSRHPDRRLLAIQKIVTALGNLCKSHLPLIDI